MVGYCPTETYEPGAPQALLSEYYDHTQMFMSTYDHCNALPSVQSILPTILLFLAFPHLGFSLKVQWCLAPNAH